MPWNKVLRLSHWTISLQCAIIAFLIFMISIQLRISPEQIVNEVRKLETAINVSNETFRQQINVNQEEINRLKSEMKHRTEQLRKANETLQKLDPKFVPFQLPEE